MRRRLVLACGCCALTMVTTPAGAQRNPAQGDWRKTLLQDRRELWLVRDEDEMRSTYWTASTGFIRDEYLNLCWFLRDKSTGRVFAMDRNLLDVLCGVQTWLTRNGHQAPIKINSGYRTMATNRKIEGAARNSKHIVGKAADIVVPGISPVKLAGMAALFGRGGTGFYVGRDFVHVDSGDERIWVDQRRKG